jgi:hypothetical protein
MATKYARLWVLVTACALAGYHITYLADAQVDNVARMQRVLNSIHRDIKAIKPKYKFLNGYNDECLSVDGTNIAIYYLPPSKPAKTKGKVAMPQMPNKIHIFCYRLDLDLKTVLKPCDDLRNNNACIFPQQGYRIGSCNVVYGNERKDLMESLNAIIINECIAEKSRGN